MACLFSFGNKMELKVFIQVVNGRIDCICLQSNKGCDGNCIKDSVTYDQDKDITECIANKGNKNYKDAR